MNTLITAFLLAAQSAQAPADLSRFNQLMEKQRQATHAARYAEAERLGREAELIAQRLPDPGSHLIMARNELANTLAWQGRHAEAVELLEKTPPLAMSSTRMSTSPPFCSLAPSTSPRTGPRKRN